MIEFQNVSKWYGDIMGVISIGFHINKGMVGLLGPNGAGKSTLLKLVVGILKPDQGAVRVFGTDPFLGRRDYTIGYVPEHTPFYDNEKTLDVLRRFAFYHDIPGKRFQQRLEDIDAFLEISAFYHKRVKSLSKGMKQRLKLAVSLLHEPKLLILDEPFNGLDPVSRIRISQHLKELAAERLILVSSHILSEVEQLTREIIVINQGTIFAQGNLEDIRERMDRIPRRIRLIADNLPAILPDLVQIQAVNGLEIDNDRKGVRIFSMDPTSVYEHIMTCQAQGAIDIRYLHIEDESLEAIFSYITEEQATS